MNGNLIRSLRVFAWTLGVKKLSLKGVKKNSKLFKSSKLIDYANVIILNSCLLNLHLLMGQGDRGTEGQWEKLRESKSEEDPYLLSHPRVLIFWFRTVWAEQGEGCRGKWRVFVSFNLKNISINYSFINCTSVNFYRNLNNV